MGFVVKYGNVKWDVCFFYSSSNCHIKLIEIIVILRNLENRKDMFVFFFFPFENWLLCLSHSSIDMQIIDSCAVRDCLVRIWWKFTSRVHSIIFRLYRLIFFHTTIIILSLLHTFDTTISWRKDSGHLVVD